MGQHLCCLVPCADHYTGQWKRGRKHGRGTYFWKDGSTYEGDWVSDKQHGNGTCKAPPISIHSHEPTSIKAETQLISVPVPTSLLSYTGEWVSGFKQGEGLAVYEDGTVYTGSWKSDCWHGAGELVSKDGSSYVGSFASNCFAGHGVCNRAGDVFEGEFVNNVMHGEGRWSKVSGEQTTVITGNFVQGVLTQGVISTVRDNRCEIYQGEILNGEKHGFGTITYSNGESLSCNFVHGEPVDASGNVNQTIFGRYHYADGSVYEGCLIANDQAPEQSSSLSQSASAPSVDAADPLKHPNAECSVSPAEVTVCLFLRHGDGELRGVDQTLYQGEFNRDFRSGFGHQLYADGSEYEGDWVNDRRCGRGWFISADPLEPRYEGEWRDDERHGRGRLFYPVIGSTGRTVRTLSLIQSSTPDGSTDPGLTVNIEEDEAEDVFCSQFVHGKPVDITSNLRLAPFRMLQARIIELDEQLKASKQLESVVDPATACRMCYKVTADAMVLDCAHMALCSGCAKGKPKRCPKCQADVKRIITVIEA